MPAPAEAFASPHHKLYDGIAPEKYIGTNKGRVAFITGASKGLGLESAKAFAASGASVFISARSVDALAKLKAEIEAEYKVPVAYTAIDVSKEESVKAAVAKAVETFGKIDIVVSNAGGGENNGTIGELSVDSWWEGIDLNLKGTFTVATYTIPELRKTQGYIILLSSSLAQIRLPGGSSYNLAKLATIRLAEWLHTENAKSGVKAIAMHPGAVATAFSSYIVDKNPGMGLKEFFTDDPKLNAWTQVRLTSGSEDWLSGRFFDATWGLDEVAKQKEAILEEDALKIRLALPRSS
ncbi:hypothetical protein FRC01_011700 [Tulasnella sp. 417]|nr:hypothetical protein FRC01_011700 [Tulasnella sp. 417]